MKTQLSIIMFLAIVAENIFAQQPVIVKDINQVGASSNPSGFVNVNGTLFFTTNNSNYSQASLWKSDGTASGTVLVKAFVSCATGVNVNGILFFVADDGLKGQELWKSDGTVAGTIRVKDINNTGPGKGSYPNSLTNVNGTLFFTADDGVNGEELWKSDGTSTGTVIVKDVCPGSCSGIPSGWYNSEKTLIVNVNGTVFFKGNDGQTGIELWKSDGTTNGTTITKDINVGSGDGLPIWMINGNGTLYFFAYYSAGGRGLWKSDGTYNGTIEIKSGISGNSSWDPVNDLSDLTYLNGTLFFSTSVGNWTITLWKSDGTDGGTYALKQIYSGTNSYYISNFIASNNILFFTAGDDIYGDELWKSDGTAIGTVIVKDIYPGSKSSNPDGLSNISGTLYFGAKDSLNGYEVWKSDGTTAGTVLVKDIYTGGAGSGQYSGSWYYPFGEMNGVAYFAANDGNYGVEPWKSDGTLGGTQLLKDINQNGTLGSNPAGDCSYWWGNSNFMANVNGTLVFPATDGPNGTELWKSNGVASGTVLVKDITSGSVGSNIASLTGANNQVFFTKNDYEANISEFWKSDGTDSGSQKITGIGGYNFSIYEIVNVNNEIFLSGYDNNNNTFYLYKTDGNNVSIIKSRVKDSYGTGNMYNLIKVNNILFFFFDEGLWNTELWKTDGTISGTNKLITISVSQCGNEYGPFIDINGILYFGREYCGGSTDLWKSDGTTWGTQIVKYFNGTNAYLGNFINHNGILIFTIGNSSWVPPEVSVWKSDGTNTGTTEIKSFNNYNLANFVSTNGIIYFVASDNNAAQLWKSDGTTNGTIKIKDFTSIGNLLGTGGTCFFSADDGSSGVELWKSDGTTAGTVLVSDIFPGTNSYGGNSSYPCNFIVMDGTLYFSADDGINGKELWKLTGVPNGIEKINNENSILKVFPNPFNTSTKISYTLFSSSSVTLEIYNSIGQKISSLVDNEKQTTGNYEFTFTERQNGIFFVKLQVEDKIYSYSIIQTK